VTLRLLVSGSRRLVSSSRRLVSGSLRLVSSSRRLVSGSRRLVSRSRRLVSGSRRFEGMYCLHFQWSSGPLDIGTPLGNCLRYLSEQV
jgi:hypothetical protein